MSTPREQAEAMGFTVEYYSELDSLKPADRRAFEDRAAEREVYKANALSRGYLMQIRFRPGVFAIDELILPGKIVMTEPEFQYFQPQYGP